MTDIVISDYVQTYATKDLELTHIRGQRYGHPEALGAEIKRSGAETAVDLAVTTVDLADSMTKTIRVL